jgi:pectate lyase
MAGASGSGPRDCMTPPPASELVGWATQDGGTTGGGDETPMVVTTAQQLTQALSGSAARVIHVSGVISGSFNITSNKSVIGVCGAEIRGHIGIGRESNIILRNLKIVGQNCSDSPNDCSGGSDAVGINGGSHHIWADHLDVSDGSDGNFDITQGSDFITVSWTKFSYSTRRTDPQAGTSGHRFSNLIGASDTDPSDVNHLNITYHHCWWADNVDQRMPRSRRGQIHLFNNLFTASGNSYCSNAGQDAKLLVQNSIYSGVNNPFQVSNNGTLRSEGNDFPGATGNQNGSGNGFMPPYAVTLDPLTGLEDAIRQGAGPQM